MLFSADAVTWTPAGGTQFNNVGIRVHHANGFWVAVGDNGGVGDTILRSADNGSTWQSTTGGFGRQGWGVYYADDGGLGVWVAVGANVLAGGGGNTILRSTDNGSSWSGLAGGAVQFTNQGWSVYYANSVWIAVGNGNTILRSTDGLTWTTTQTGGYGYNVYYADGVWIAVGLGNTILQSTDDGFDLDHT